MASQPTLSRFENAVTIADLKRLRDVLCDEFLAAFTVPPSRITLDIDAFDDPAHGQQQLIFFHGHYEQYQYLPIAITCAETLAYCSPVPCVPVETAPAIDCTSMSPRFGRASPRRSRIGLKS